MGIESALYTGVSGLDAMSEQLSVIGNNISNSNTVGFKAGNVTFANLLSTSLGATSSTQTGNGVTLQSVQTDFSQGTLQTTSDALDLAIQGDGFFSVKSPNGSLYYTRAGQFSVDQLGNIVDPNGDYLQGAVAVNQPVTTSTGATTAGTFGAIGDINISAIGVGAPTQTANATIYANLSDTTAAVNGSITITTSNDQISIVATAIQAAAITVLIPTGTYTAGSSFAADVGSAVNQALWNANSAACAAAFAGSAGGTDVGGSAPISVSYGSALSGSQYQYTINNVSNVGDPAGTVTVDWNSNLSTAANMMGFTGTSTLTSELGTTASSTGQFQVNGFDPNNPGSAFSTAMTVYDSGGNSHLINVYFENIGADSSAPGGGNRWMYWAVVPASDSATGNAEIGSSGVLDFNDNGALYAVNPNLNPPATTTYTDDQFNFSNGVASKQSIAFDFGQKTDIANGGSGTTGTTEYGSPSSVSNQFQDGYAAGSLSSYSVSQTGIITGTFTNGETKNIAQIQLARFNAPTQLSNVGNNLYTQSASSGQPIPGLAGQAGFGAIFSDSLEESNVDLSGEFVNMITVQSAYEADAKVISTAQQLFTALQNAKQ